MKIALDYDQTFTADPALWTPFVQHAKARGHDIRFLTYRLQDSSLYTKPEWRTNADIELDATRLNIPIIYTNHKAKKDHWDPDIWVDDKPETIFEDMAVAI